MGKGFPTYYHIDSLKTQSTTKMHVKRQKVYFIVLNLGLELNLFPSGYSIFLFFSRGENSRKYTGASTNREGFADILNASLTGKICWTLCSSSQWLSSGRTRSQPWGLAARLFLSRVGLNNLWLGEYFLNTFLVFKKWRIRTVRKIGPQYILWN